MNRPRLQTDPAAHAAPPDSVGGALPAEETLDPTSWGEFGELAHQALDDILYYLETVRERPVWSPVPPEVEAALDEPLPREGQGAEATYRAFLENVLPYPHGNIHPRFWGWVNGTGSPLGVVADLLASGMNCNVTSSDQAAARIEARVLAWMRELVGLPEGASGLLVSGGSAANLVGLTVARNDKAGFDVRRSGLAAGPRLKVYACSTVHSSVQKAIEMLGLGSDALRRLPARADHTIDLAAVSAAVREDRAAGHRPIALVVSAGAVDVGALDDLSGAADLAAEEGLWLHVDGAIGGLAVLSERLRPRVSGIERADSVVLDLHKWLHVPFEGGLILVRRGEAQRAAFELTPPYLTPINGSVSGQGMAFKDLGLQLSRRFNALKVWMSLKAEGADKFGRLIEQNVDQATYLARRIEAEPELELLAPVPLNIVCFRYRGAARSEATLDGLNQQLLVRLHRSGVAVPNSTRIDGRFAIRVSITNHRSRREDFDLLVETVLEIGRELR
jgi:aromatic-L-amino-acid/L-tryptophan decarboxylase